MASAHFQKYLETLRLSQLFEPAELDAKVAAFLAGEAERDPFAERDAAARLGEHLVATNVLTQWQQNFLIAGKYKGLCLGKYCILRQIGAGGMGQVYLARHRQMKRQVAIKVLPEELTKDGSYLERFHREARAIAAVDHPNLVRAFNVDNQGNLHYLVMEFVPGETLQDKVGREGVVAPELAINIVRQSAKGLAHAHERGLIHRDIKPGNLLIDTQGTVKILDLGLAKVRRPGEKAVTVEHNDGILGTADYLAPEQAVNSTEIDARADLYSLGCTLYFMLVGHPPFDGGSVAERLLAHQKRAPTSLLSLRPDLPNDVVVLCERLMAKRPDDRFGSAEELVQYLDRLMAGEPPIEIVAPTPTFRKSAIRRKKSPVMLYATIAGVLIVGVGIAGAMMLAPDVSAVAATKTDPTKPTKPVKNGAPLAFPVAINPAVSVTFEATQPDRRKRSSFGKAEELQKLWQTPAATKGEPAKAAMAPVLRTSKPARFLRIELPGKKRILTLAEVEVISNGKNIAPHGTATQSSTHGEGTASKALDGNKSPDWNRGGQTHTASAGSSNPWWEVDLKTAAEIEKIGIWNRAGFESRLDQFTILLLDAERKEVFRAVNIAAPEVLEMEVKNAGKLTYFAYDGKPGAPSKVGAKSTKESSACMLLRSEKRITSLEPKANSPRPANDTQQYRLGLFGSHTACPLVRYQASSTESDTVIRWRAVPDFLKLFDHLLYRM